MVKRSPATSKGEKMNTVCVSVRVRGLRTESEGDRWYFLKQQSVLQPAALPSQWQKGSPGFLHVRKKTPALTALFLTKFTLKPAFHPVTTTLAGSRWMGLGCGRAA